MAKPDSLFGWIGFTYFACRFSSNSLVVQSFKDLAAQSANHCYITLMDYRTEQKGSPKLARCARIKEDWGAYLNAISADRALSKALVFFVFCTITFPAYAEVMDKLPTLAYIWGVAIISGVICLVGAYYWKWFLLLAALPATWFYSLYTELHSPDLAPAILSEAGRGYFIQSYLAGACVIVMGITGWIFNTRKHRVT